MNNAEALLTLIGELRQQIAQQDAVIAHLQAALAAVEDQAKAED